MTAMENDYTRLMQEIKERLIYAGLLCEKIRTQQQVSWMQLESCCLQVRKMLELAVMGSLVVNRPAFEKIGEDFAACKNIRVTLRQIRRLNPEFLPQPVREELTEDDCVQPITEGVLTEGLIEKIHKKCSRALHASNPFGDAVDYGYYLQELPQWLERIFRTLKSHIIVFPGMTGAYYIDLGDPHSPMTTMTLLRAK